MMRYGSSGQSTSLDLLFSADASQVRGSPRSEPPPTPPMPPETSMILGFPQERHWRCSLVAREDKVEAEMTIPGMRTSLFMVFAVRSRNCSMLRPERMVT